MIYTCIYKPCLSVFHRCFPNCSFFQLETFLFDASESAYHMIIKKIAELEEKNYAWMDACLADARCVMRS